MMTIFLSREKEREKKEREREKEKFIFILYLYKKYFNNYILIIINYILV